MWDQGRRVDGRAVALFVVLDLVTYALLYWLVLPAFDQVLLAIDPTTATAIGWVLSTVRLVLIGVVVARSYRRRLGLDARSEVVPTMVVAAVTAWGVQLVLGVVVNLLAGLPATSWRALADLLLWLGAALVAVLFVAPGPAERLPLRYRQVARGDRGATNLLLIPAAAGIMAATLLIIHVLGSSTNDAAESRTAADAAALAAADAWRERVGNAFGAAAGADDADDFWDFAGTDLGSLASAGMTDAARSYALANGADLVSMDVDPFRAQVTVRVRNRDSVPETGRRLEQVATAELDFRSGACRSGRILGYLLGGSCRTSAPAPTPTPTPTPDPSATPDPSPTPPPPPPPFEAPSGLGPFRMDTALAVTR